MNILENNRVFPVSYNASRNLSSDAAVCYAPWTSLNFNIDGTANICCLNRNTLTAVPGKTINEIWNCESFGKLRERILQNDLNYDCQICRHQIAAGNFTGVKARNYDSFIPPDPAHPKTMEFFLENTCNLDCIMCNSILSSTIRKNKNLPPLKKQYDEEFLTVLEPHIPYLKEAVFSGGEPFLIKIYYRIWEKLIRANPEIIISVITNGTILNEKIKNLMEQARFRINISIDSVDKKTYETIRRNADFDSVMNHFIWFREYGRRKNLRINIPVCPLTENWCTLPGIVRFANNHDVSVNFVYVDRPHSLSLIYRSPDYLKKIIDMYQAEKFDVVSPVSETNIMRFRGLTDDLIAIQKRPASQPVTPAIDEMLHSLDLKINGFVDQQELPAKEDLKADMSRKMRDVIAEIPEESRLRALNLIIQSPMERIYKYANELDASGLAGVIKEIV
ncbi:MAG: radical SAM protein [Bacteroidetes bacterium]|nr:radical SAM protein [Bacteroidota bacterium]